MKQGIKVALLPATLARSFRVLCLLGVVASTCVPAAEIWVDSEADGIDPGVCTLRAAIESANTNSSVGGCLAGDGFDQIWLGANVHNIELTEGALYISSSLELRHSNFAPWTIDGMSSSRVLEIDTDGPVGIFDATITGGADDSGAGLRVDGGAYVYMERVNIIGNSAVANGGGVEMLSGTIHLMNSTIQNNQAEAGGGVHMQQGQAVFEGSLIENNQAERGGGIAIEWTQSGSNSFIPLEMTDTPITGNHANDGGGLYITAANESDFFEFENLIIQQNTATGLGGGIALSHASAMFKDNLIEGNQVLGASEPEEDVGGGGIAFTNSGFLDIWMSVITENSAPRGGGIYADQGNSYGQVALNSSHVTNNYAEFHGGGIELRGGGLWSNDSQIQQNSANAGGGVFAFDAQLDLFHSHIEYNQATRGGGLVLEGQGEFANSSLQLYMEFSSIRHNQAESGGGVYLDITNPPENERKLVGLEIVDNQATQLGGGLAIIEGNLRLENALVQGNEVTGFDESEPSGGGGIAVTSSGDVFLDEALILNNSAPAGGGLYVALPEDPLWGVVTFMNGELIGNSADSGGGVALVSGNLSVWNSQLENNLAAIGGGIDVTGGYLHLEQVALEYNNAVNGGGIAIRLQEPPSPWELAVFWSTTVQSNQAEIGGGVYVEMSSEPYSEPLRLSGLHVEGNEASSMGGGIAFSGGHFELSDSTIIANIAEEGGGLHFSGGMFDWSTVLNSDVSLNEARRGGAIAVRDYHLDVHETTISVNTAALEERGVDYGSGRGGGAWVTGGGIWFQDSTLSNNLAQSAGGGIYLQESAGVVDGSRVVDNTGGGIDVEGGMFAAGYSDISGNHGGLVGGVRCSACYQMDVYHASITNNSGQLFGGIEYVPGPMPAARGELISHFFLTNSTISANTGAQVGGVMAQDASINHSTIAFNTSISTGLANLGDPIPLVSGGLAVMNPSVIRNSIIAANQAPEAPFDLSVYGPGGQPGPADINFSLIQDDSGFTTEGQGNHFGLEPGLLPLVLNGAALTLTHALQGTSPAIHNGDPEFATPPNFDQRGEGFPRLSGARLDLGAFESTLAPNPLLSEDSLDFGAVRVNDASEPMTLELSNVGDGSLTLGVVWLTDSSGVFELLQENCSEQILVPGASCQALIGFEPDQTGPFEGTLSLETNSDPAPELVTIEGQGVAAEIRVTPLSVDFGNVVAGHSSAMREIKVENTGQLPLTVDSIEGLVAPFELMAGGCLELPLDLQAGESCSFELVFTPPAIDVFEKTIIFTSDADRGASSIDLSGAGVDTALFEDRFEGTDTAP